MFDKIIDSVNRIGDHVHALLIIGCGGFVSLFPGHHDLGLTLITTGAALWKGKQ